MLDLFDWFIPYSALKVKLDYIKGTQPKSNQMMQGTFYNRQLLVKT